MFRESAEIDGKDYWYEYDGRGSVIGVANANGKERENYKYDPYGNVTTSGILNVANPYQYNGEYTDDATDYQYLRARYYRSETGSFITADTYAGNITNPLSLNRYTYTHNNPIMGKDPSGFFFKEIGNWLGDRGNDIKNGLQTVGNWFSDRGNDLKNGTRATINWLDNLSQSIKNWRNSKIESAKNVYNISANWLNSKVIEINNGINSYKIKIKQGMTKAAIYSMIKSCEGLDSIKKDTINTWNSIFNPPKDAPLGTTNDIDNIITSEQVPKDNIDKRKSINIVEWHPLEGFTQTMMGGNYDPNSIDISTKTIYSEGAYYVKANNGKTIKQGKIYNQLSSGEGGSNFASTVDGINFVLTWMSNSQQITQLQAIKTKDGKLSLEYGSPIEMKYSGRKLDLSEAVVDKYYNIDPMIIFTASKKEDEIIRDAFNLSGDGKYSMQLNMGKVFIGDLGYRLSYEDGIMYQIPIIHEDTTMNVYYTENGKTSFAFDAADILRKTKIQMNEEETSRIINQLVKEGYLYN